MNTTDKIMALADEWADQCGGCDSSHLADNSQYRKALRAEIESLVRDAERYRWLAGYCRSTPEHWGGRWSIVIEGPCPKTQNSGDDLDAAIDAAMQEKQS